MLGYGLLFVVSHSAHDDQNARRSVEIGIWSGNFVRFGGEHGGLREEGSGPR